MNPSTNSPSSEPTRVEIVYSLTPEQQQLQRTVQKRLQGVCRLFPVFLLVFLMAFLVVAGGMVFVFVQIASHLPH